MFAGGGGCGVYFVCCQALGVPCLSLILQSSAAPLGPGVNSFIWTSSSAAVSFDVAPVHVRGWCGRRVAVEGGRGTTQTQLRGVRGAGGEEGWWGGVEGGGRKECGERHRAI